MKDYRPLIVDTINLLEEVKDTPVGILSFTSDEIGELIEDLVNMLNELEDTNGEGS